MFDVQGVVLVIVAAKHEIYARDLPRKLLVMLHPHVRQGNDHVAFVFLFEPPGVLSGTPLVVLVNDVDLQVLERGDPLMLRNP